MSEPCWQRNFLGQRRMRILVRCELEEARIIFVARAEALLWRREPSWKREPHLVEVRNRHPKKCSVPLAAFRGKGGGGGGTRSNHARKNAPVAAASARLTSFSLLQKLLGIGHYRRRKRSCTETVKAGAGDCAWTSWGPGHTRTRTKATRCRVRESRFRF